MQNPSPSDNGAQSAADLLPTVYDELKKLANARMAWERTDHTLQATALVNEAYLRLVASKNGAGWESRAHFFAAAAEAMRRILVNHARERAAEKRGGGWNRVSLESITQPEGVGPEEFLQFSDLISKLEAKDPKAGQIVKLRVFAGMAIPEISEATGIPQRTVDRLWAFARAWLHSRLQPDS